jgi:hypothetical protein
MSFASECPPGPFSPLSDVFWGATLTHFLPPYFLLPFARLMNMLRPQSIKRIDPREDGILRTSYLTKFLESCFVNGFPPEELFLRDDLIDATSESLARVANTIIALVKWAEIPTPTRPHVLRRKGGNTKPDEKPRLRQPTRSGHPQVGAGNSSPIPIPPKRRTVHKYIAHPKRKKSNVQSTKNQSNSWSMRNQSNSSSMRNQSAAYSMTNRLTTHRRTKQSITPKNATVIGTIGTHSSPVPEAGFGNESGSIDKVGSNPRVPLIESVVDPLVVSGVCMSASDDSKSGKVFVLGGRARRGRNL